MVHRKTKECFGCGDLFITYRNYDYCVDCAVNNNRYLPNSPCPECDGSGMIKFRYQPPRPCKLCSLTNSMPKKPVKKLTPEQAQEQAEQQFWSEVDLLAQEKIYQLFTKNIPLSNLNLITEPYRYEDRQEKLTGLFLHKDTDYRTLLVEVGNQYEELPEAKILAEEIALWYCRMVIKALISDLSDYTIYENHYFENLTPDGH